MHRDQTKQGTLVSSSVKQPSKIQSPLYESDSQAILAQSQREGVETGSNGKVAYMSAHNPQTPSNAQMKIFEQDAVDESAKPSQDNGNVGMSDRLNRSHYESASSFKANQHVQPHSMLNAGQHRRSVEKLKDDRSMTFQMAAENQLKSSSSNMLEKLAPDVVLRANQITLDPKNNHMPTVDQMINSSEALPQAVDSHSRSTQNRLFDSSHSTTNASQKQAAVGTTLILQRSQITKARASQVEDGNGVVHKIQNASSGLGQSLGEGQNTNQMMIMTNELQMNNNLFNGIDPSRDVGSRTIDEEGTYHFLSPSNNQTFAQLQQDDILLHQQTTEEDYESSQSGSGHRRDQYDQNDTEADQSVQMIITRQGSAKQSAKSRQEQLQVGGVEKGFSATANQSKSLLDPIGRDGSNKHQTPDPTNNEEVEDIAEIKEQMIQEQRENQKSATGHNYGNFKLTGIHILEMYNPLKKFFAQAQNGGKESQKKTDKKNTESVKEAKSKEDANNGAATNKSNNNKLASTTTTVANSDLAATQTIAKTGNRKNQSMRFRQPKLVVNAYYTKYAILRKVVKHDFKM